MKKKLKIIFIFSLSIKVLGLLYRIITTRLLGIEGMRFMAMIMPALSLCLCLSSLSIQSVCNRNIASILNTGKTKVSVILLSGLRITIVSSSIISIILLCSFPIYQYLYGTSFIYYPMLLCIPVTFCSNITGVMRGYFEANNKFFLTYAANLLEQIVKIAFTILLLYVFEDQSVENKIIICFLGLGFSELASCLLLAFKIKKYIRKEHFFCPTNHYEKQILRYALPLTAESVIVSVSGYITPFIFYFACSLSSISLLEATTYYTIVNSYGIALLVSCQFGVYTMAKVAFPNITRHTNEKEKVNRIINKTLALSMLLAIVSFALCFFYANDVLLFLYKTDASASIVKYLALFFVFLYLDPIFMVILQAYKQEKKLMLSALFSQILTILAIFLLTLHPLIKEKGYVIGLSIGYTFKFIYLVIHSIKNSHFKPDNKLFYPVITIICYLIANILYNNLIYFTFLTLLFVVGYLLLYYFLYSKKEAPGSLVMHK